MPTTTWFVMALLVLAAGALSLIAGLPARDIGTGDMPTQASTAPAGAMTRCSPMVLA